MAPRKSKAFFYAQRTSTLSVGRRAGAKFILKEFRNDDAEKRSRLDAKKTSALDRAMKQARLLNPVMPFLRVHYDKQSVEHIRQKTNELLHG